MLTAALFALVYVPMLIEAFRARANERAQLARGGLMPPGDVYRIMAIAYPAAFAVMILEGGLRGGSTCAAIAAGLVIFIGAKAFKWWAIVSLGEAWTFRVIVVPGMTLVRSGPYRVFPHPNYVAVAGELVGIALAAGAIVTGPIATICFVALMLKRVRVERAALDAILTNSRSPHSKFRT